MGDDGERRKTYSAAVIDGFKRNSTIYVGDSMVRKTYTSRPGYNIAQGGGRSSSTRTEHATERERVEKIMGSGNGGSILVGPTQRDEQRRQVRKDIDSGEYRNLLKKTKQARVGKNLIRNLISVWKHDPMIHEFEEDGSQLDGGAALQGRGSGIRGFLGQLCGERRNVSERWSAS